MTRLAIARLWFCSNSFTPRRTPLDDFLACEWTANGDPQPDPAPGSDMAGLRRFLATRPDWEATFLRGASAPAGGPLLSSVLQRWIIDVEAALLRGRFDAVYLSLHGACQAEGDNAADLTVLRRVRAAVGRIPVVASFDMHANLSPETALLLDGASANRVWPHGGADDAATRALELLAGIVERGSRPIGAFVRVPSVLGALDVRRALAQAWSEELPALGAPVLDASVFGGFAWGDTPYAGPSAMVWAERDLAAARGVAHRLAARLASYVPPRKLALPRPERAIAAALLSGRGPLLLLDASDDPAAGGLADTTGMLRAMLDAGLDRAAFGVLCDPDTVAAAQEAGEGGFISRALGGGAAPFYGMPVAGEMEVVRLLDGPGGERSAAGMSLLRMRGIEVLVSGTRGLPAEPSTFLRAGVALDRLQVLGVKGGETARQAFVGRFPSVAMCNGSGPTCPDLANLPFRDVPAIRRAPSAALDAGIAGGIDGWSGLGAQRPDSAGRTAEQRGAEQRLEVAAGD